MADSKITALTAISTVDPTADPLVIVDVSDTSMAASGTTKKSTINQLLGSGGTATLASATITGDLTAARLIVTGGTIPTNGLWLPTTNTLEFSANGLAQYRIAPLGVFNWYDGAGGTRMTLNANGLGIGVTPSVRLHALTTALIGARIESTSASNGALIDFKDASTTSTAKVMVGSNGDALRLYSGGNVSATLDASGNLGIGVTPSAWATSFKALQVGIGGCVYSRTADQTQVGFGSNVYFDTTDNRFEYVGTGQSALYRQDLGVHQWSTAPSGTAGNAITFTQAMTLDASGNLLVGTTSGTLFRIISSFLSSSGNGGIKLIDSQSNNTAAFANFSNGTGTLGSITNNNNGGVLYNTLSDYRLKEAVQPLVGGLARVNALKPSIYKWKTNGSNGEGFLAHELAEIVPAAVCGEKDAVNEDGSIKSQGVDMSRVVPILVAAIQELTARVQTLETR